MNTNELKQLLKPGKKTVYKPSQCLSSGSTLLNLACSGHPRACFTPGHYYFIVGDSNSGKTFLCLTCFAEATQNKNFDNYRLIYDNIEDGAVMDWEAFFGKAVAERVEPPEGSKEDPVYSETVEEFYDHLDDALLGKQPVVYILDSENALISEEDEEQFKKEKAARRKGKEVGGSYGVAKAREHSKGLARVMPKLRATNSILIIVGQTRDNLNKLTAQLVPKTRSGGRALTFYATLEMWSAPAGAIKKNVRGKDRAIGIWSKIRVKKNRITGKDRTIIIPILTSYGIDDTRSCVDYLIEEGHWKGTKNTVDAPEFEFSGNKEKLCQLIEETEQQIDLRKLVQGTWNEIEELLKTQRQKRYE